MSSILNTHAPLKTKSVSPKLPNPWITPAIQAAKRTRRYLDRVWRKSRFPSDRSKYAKQAHLSNSMMERARRKHIANYIHENENDAGKLWRAVNSVLHRAPNTSMPSTSDITTLCHSFSTFFVNKIGKIRMKFCDPKHNVPHIPPPEINFPMTSFEPATADEVKKLILSSQDKSCDLDPLPTKLLKSCLDILLTPITNIVNLSLESGSFPDVLKVSHITPLLKKPSLSKDDMKNYRPVSNLKFISKIIEKIISNRIRSHLDKNNLSNPNQSAYKHLHSTETALLKIHNDICMNMDTGKTTALVLLDLSAAFDTLDHSSIIELLSVWYGISGTAVNWVRSYLSNRVQRVKLLDKHYGVPQGSVLGPLLFTLYTTPLSSVISRQDICHHLYADDTQIYVFSFQNRSWDVTVASPAVLARRLRLDDI